MPSQQSTDTAFWKPKYWLIWFGYGLARLLLLLPFPFLISLGRMLGKLLYKIASGRRHVVEVNGRIAFPEHSEAEHHAFVIKTFEENGIGLMESMLAWWGNKEDLLQRVSYEGLEHLLEANKQGKGVLIIAAHYSALELGGLFIGDKVIMDAIYRRHNNPLLEKLITQGRLRFCHKAIEKRELRSALRSLRDNHCIWYAPDQDMGKDASVFVPFFGHPAATLTATSRMALLNHSPVVICSYHRNDDDLTYTVRFSKPLEGFPSGDLEADATRINQLLEACIRIQPAQYLWLHKRYKNQPDGRNHLYR